MDAFGGQKLKVNGSLILAGWKGLIQQVLASPELQIRLPEPSINETYVNDDLEDCLSHHKIPQQGSERVFKSIEGRLSSFFG